MLAWAKVRRALLLLCRAPDKKLCNSRIEKIVHAGAFSQDWPMNQLLISCAGHHRRFQLQQRPVLPFFATQEWDATTALHAASGSERRFKSPHSIVARALRST